MTTGDYEFLTNTLAFTPKRMFPIQNRKSETPPLNSKY